ncbi:MAG: hypothetical protein AAF997_08785 [Myxococcota bacterium]
MTFSAAFRSEEEYVMCLETVQSEGRCDFAPPVAGDTVQLERSELDQLMTLFSSVAVRFSPDPCIGFSVDPCRVIRITWDDLETSDLFCMNPDPRIQGTLALDVLEAVSSLRP